MKDKLIKVLVNAVIGVLSSVVAIYLGGQTVEAVTAAGAAAGTLGARASELVSQALA